MSDSKEITKQNLINDLLSIESDQLIPFNLIEVLAGEKAGTTEELNQLKKMEDKAGLHFYQDVLFALTQEKFEPQESKNLFDSIITHKWNLGTLLNRNVGLRVATLDYLSNIRNVFQDFQMVRFSKVSSMAKVTVRDSLTNLYDRASFVLLLKEQMSQSVRYQKYLSLIMIDIDHFKIINDQHGHLSGNFILEKTSQQLRNSLRVSDIAARFGGEEFLVCLPETNQDQAINVAEKLRRDIHDTVFDDGQKQYQITISIGVTTLVPYDDFKEDTDFLINVADKALYRAKMNGRNRVEYLNSLEEKIYAH